MQISAFLERFIDKIKRVFPEDSSTLHLYTHNLLVKKGTKSRPANSTLTFRDAGIDDNAICRLRGYIRVEYLRPLLTIGYGKELVELMDARKNGFVFMDEHDSITFEEARDQGLLSQNVIDRVERFPYKSSGTFFCVFCPEADIEDSSELAERI